VTWYVHYAGVRVGMIVERSGVANTAEPWEWHSGFYPGERPGEQRYGRAASFEAARMAFEAAWRDYLPRRSEAEPPEISAPDYLHCFAFLRSSIVCRHHDAQPQPGVAHFFEQAFMQALTSQLTASADGAKAYESP
jgi:hypothetical protein